MNELTPMKFHAETRKKKKFSIAYICASQLGEEQ